MAQTKISGTVTDKKGNPIAGANIYVENSYDGASSGAEGQYSFSCFEEGPQLLVASFLGYKKFTQEVMLDGTPLTINISLQEIANELNTVVITAGSFEASDENKAVIFKPLDIVTTAGAAGDISGALNTLPGTSIVGEEGGLFVRGGEGYETKTFIDGLLVQKPYTSSVPDIPSRGRFSPFLFSGTVFSTGGYSAEYGQALSSALILKTNDLFAQTQSGAYLMTVGFGGSHTQAWKKSGLSVNAGYTNLEPYFWLMDQKLEYDKAPESFNGGIIYRKKVGEKGMFKVMSNFSSTNLGLRYPVIGNDSITTPFALKNNNAYINTTYRAILSDKWTYRTGISLNYNLDDLDIDGIIVKNTETATQGKIAFTNLATDKLKIDFGALYLYKTNAEDFNDPMSMIDTTTSFNEHFGAAFAEASITLSTKFAIRAGGRFEYSALLKEYNIAPRVSLAYKVGEHGQSSLAYGQFFQTPESPYLRLTNDLIYERADHYILNYQWANDDRVFRIEAYYKLYKDLVKYDSTYQYSGESYTNDGEGYSRGIDVFFRDQKTIKSGDYWLSYSFLDTERDYRDFPETAVPRFASAHNFSVVYKHFFPGISTQFGATYTFTSGRPYNDPNVDGFNTERTKTYNDLSLNASYLTNIAGNFTVVYASVSNVLGFNNVYGYRYSPLPNSEGTFESQAIEPPAKRFFVVGCFVSFNYEKKEKKPNTDITPTETE